MKPGGHLILEIGTNQEGPVRSLIGAQTGLTLAPTVFDHAQHPRVIRATRIGRECAIAIFPVPVNQARCRFGRDSAKCVRQRAHGRPALILAAGGQLPENVAEFVGQLWFDDRGIERFVLMRCSIIVVVLVASYGRRSVRNSKAITPNAKMSIRSSIGSRLSSSGAMYCSVPVRLPGRQNAGVLGTVRPKSINFTLLLAVDQEIPRIDVVVDEPGGVNRRQSLGGLGEQLDLLQPCGPIATRE